MDKPSAIWENCLEYASLSDVGMRRSNNQDALAVVVVGDLQTWGDRGHLFMVADGMGAHAAGELASKLAVDIVSHAYFKLRELPPPQALESAILDANAKIHARGQANVEFQGMGTTSSALVLLPQGALVGQVGDSRVYRLRENRLEQLSFDHSLVWEMQAGREIDERNVPSYIPKNIITRSLGPNPEVKVDLEGPFPLAVGDTFLVCSDGLSGLVSDDEIGVLLGSLPIEEAAPVLVDLANLRGGPDNITVILVRVAGAEITGGAAPLSDRRAAPSPDQGASWLPWGGLGLLLAATVGLLVVQNYPAALLSLLATLVMGVILLIRGSGRQGAERPEAFEPRPDGGPYTSRVCQASNTFVDKLAKLAEQLIDAADQQNWNIDRETFHTLRKQALDAAAKKDYAAAVRRYCQAISQLMAQVRGQGRSAGADVSRRADR